MRAEDERRRILEDVAGGRTTPEQAAVLLEDVAEEPPREEPEAAARRIRVEGSFHSLKIVGDRDVREAVAEGEHTVVREGDSLVIHGEMSGLSGWAFLGHRGRVDLTGIHARPTLQVRMNPELPLEVDLDAGGLSVTDVRGPIRAEVDAGGVRIDGFHAPIDVRVDAGGITLRGVLSNGGSRVQCDAGAVKLHLERGSSVRVRAQTSVGKIVLPGPGVAGSSRHLGGTGEATVGEGAGTLDIEVSVGAVKVTAD